MAQKNPGKGKREHITNLSISDSTVLLGDHNDHIQMTNADGGCNAEDEQEILRIYKKLDIRHKNKFMTQVFEFEDMFDEQDE